MKRIILFSIGMGLLLMAGCGSGTRRSASASGTVSTGGKPVTGAMINFMDSKSGSAASCDLNEKGEYSISQGLPPATYKVSVFPKSSPSQAPQPGQSPPPAPVSNVPLKYRSDATSGLTAEIKPGANPNLDFKLD